MVPGVLPGVFSRVVKDGRERDKSNKKGTEKTSGSEREMNIEMGNEWKTKTERA